MHEIEISLGSKREYIINDPLGASTQLGLRYVFFLLTYI